MLADETQKKLKESPPVLSLGHSPTDGKTSLFPLESEGIPKLKMNPPVSVFPLGPGPLQPVQGAK